MDTTCPSTSFEFFALATTYPLGGLSGTERGACAFRHLQLYAIHLFSILTRMKRFLSKCALIVGFHLALFSIVLAAYVKRFPPEQSYYAGSLDKHALLAH